MKSSFMTLCQEMTFQFHLRSRYFLLGAVILDSYKAAVQRFIVTRLSSTVVIIIEMSRAVS